MIIKVVCAGKDDFSKLYTQDENEFLIGVDGGCTVLLKNRLKIDLAIGDFDSAPLNRIKSKAEEILTYSENKDHSDLELAIKHIASKDFLKKATTRKSIKQIIVYNATGKRLDHYHAVINVLIRYMHLPIIIVDKDNRIEIVNSKTKFKKTQYEYISFFAIDEGTEISLTGFKYNLTKHPLKLYDSLGLSNQIEEAVASLETNNKKILVIQSN